MNLLVLLIFGLSFFLGQIVQGQSQPKLAGTHGSSIWRAATGVFADRMLASTNDVGISLNHPAWAGMPLYRTIWKRGNEEVLVCLQYPGMELFGTPYNVAIVNTNMQIGRRGTITAYQDDTPYCIAEVMTNDERLPQGLRGKWLLSIGFWQNHFQERCRLLDPKGAAKSPADVEAIIEKLPSEFYFELIHWTDAEVRPKFGAGNLFRIHDLKFRWIEPSTNILAIARQNPAGSFTFTMPKAALEKSEKPTKSSSRED